MPTETAVALAIFALLLGMGIAWWHFREDLERLVFQLEDAEDATAAAVKTSDSWQARALAAEANLELVLGEGDRSPLTAPLQVIRGGAL